MPILPGFTEEGTLPPGEYPLTLTDLQSSLLVVGPGDAEHWDAPWRLELTRRLEAMTSQLWLVGIEEIVIDGSFVEDKDHPNDIDGYFACDPKRIADGSLLQELNAIDPEKCWTWERGRRLAYRGYPKKQLPMWHAYRIELYPHYTGLIAGRDEHGVELEFPAYFRKCRRTGAPKGVVRIVRESGGGVNATKGAGA